MFDEVFFFVSQIAKMFFWIFQEKRAVDVLCRGIFNKTKRAVALEVLLSRGGAKTCVTIATSDPLLVIAAYIMHFTSVKSHLETA